MKVKIRDMNSYRRATRDLLLEYDQQFMPPRPRAAGLAYVYKWLTSNQAPQEDSTSLTTPSTTDMHMVYPWEHTNLGILSAQLYTLAANSGFTGTLQEFNTYFGYYLEKNEKEIIFDTFENFPAIGVSTMLYFDLNENILYCWADGKYLPVNAMLIANTIVDGGEA